MKTDKTEIEKKYRNLEMPESIRTPGRTWTTYPEAELEETDFRPEVEIETEGDVKVFRGDEALDRGKRFMDQVKYDENRLTALHAYRVNSIIYIEASGKSEVNIEYSGEGPLHSHLIVDSSDMTELSVTEEFRGSGEIQTSITEVYTGKNSTAEYGAVEASEADLRYSVRKALVERDSSMNWLNSMFRGDLSRTRIETVLNGDNSSTEKTAVWYPVEDQHFDISLWTFHNGENTKCDMDSRAVVDDKARSVYEGLQQVQQSAEDTKSFQDQETLILSDKAENDASPKLMIENPDVEASHAAAAGNIEDEELHYLESRGLEEDAAERLVVKGYFEPVMREISLPDLKEVIRDEVQRKLDR
jgi:Fe-S cluster assembly protein SufD